MDVKPAGEFQVEVEIVEDCWRQKVPRGMVIDRRLIPASPAVRRQNGKADMRNTHRFTTH